MFDDFHMPDSIFDEPQCKAGAAFLWCHPSAVVGQFFLARLEQCPDDSHSVV